MGFVEALGLAFRIGIVVVFVHASIGFGVYAYEKISEWKKGL